MTLARYEPLWARAALLTTVRSPPGLSKKFGPLLNTKGAIVPSSKPPLTTTCVGQLSTTVCVVVAEVVVNEVDTEVESTSMTVVTVTVVETVTDAEFVNVWVPVSVVCVGVRVTVTVVKLVDAVSVVVLAVTPKHEHALEYRTVPEQGEAYEGTALFVRVTARAFRNSSSRRICAAAGEYEVTVTVPTMTVVVCVETLGITDVEVIDCTLVKSCDCVVVTVVVVAV